MSAEVVDIGVHRASARREHLRKTLILTFKNPLLKLTKEQLEQVRQGVARQIISVQASSEELRIKWELLQEVLADVN